jgi:hypothetical protein
MTNDVQQTDATGLFDFIIQKQLAYEEPQREGTPRGEKIGLSSKKHLATLFTGLTNIKLKTLGEDLKKTPLNVDSNDPKKKRFADDLNELCNTSYGLVRKWRTENDFKNQIEDYCDECAYHILKIVEDNVYKDNEILNNYYAGETDEMPELTRIDTLYRDAPIYSVELRCALYNLSALRQKVAEDNYKDKKIDQGQLDLERAIVLIIIRILRSTEGSISTLNDALLSNHTKFGVSLVKQMISEKQEFTKKEQRMMLYTLSTIEKYFEELISDQTDKNGQK